MVRIVTLLLLHNVLRESQPEMRGSGGLDHPTLACSSASSTPVLTTLGIGGDLLARDARRAKVTTLWRAVHVATRADRADALGASDRRDVAGHGPRRGQAVLRGADRVGAASRERRLPDLRMRRRQPPGGD